MTRHGAPPLAAKEIERWFLRVDAIRSGKKFLFGAGNRIAPRAMPLAERRVIYTPPVITEKTSDGYTRKRIVGLFAGGEDVALSTQTRSSQTKQR